MGWFFMKIRRLALALGLSLFLTACGTPAETPPQDEAEDPIVVLPLSDEETRSAFGAVLWDAYLRGVLPDGEGLDWTDPEGAAENDFALLDVDGDGQEELLLYWTNACMAGMGLHVFGYANGAVYEELRAFPMVTFYDNGVVLEEWSHNQGLAGAREDFWPYDLYTYDTETDTYQRMGSVDGWDYRMTSAGPTHQVFPTDIDADGDGMVYFLLPADWNGSYSSSYLTDGPEYEAWRAGYLEGAQPLDIASHTQKLTEDHIAALGCPKPDVPVQEPAG